MQSNAWQMCRAAPAIVFHSYYSTTPRAGGLEAPGAVKARRVEYQVISREYHG